MKRSVSRIAAVAALAILAACAHQYSPVGNGAAQGELATLRFNSQIALTSVDGQPFKTDMSLFIGEQHSVPIASGIHHLTVNVSWTVLNHVYTLRDVPFDASFTTGHAYRIVCSTVQPVSCVTREEAN